MFREKYATAPGLLTLGYNHVKCVNLKKVRRLLTRCTTFARPTRCRASLHVQSYIKRECL